MFEINPNAFTINPKRRTDSSYLTPWVLQKFARAKKYPRPERIAKRAWDAIIEQRHPFSDSHFGALAGYGLLKPHDLRRYIDQAMLEPKTRNDAYRSVGRRALSLLIEIENTMSGWHESLPQALVSDSNEDESKGTIGDDDIEAFACLGLGMRYFQGKPLCKLGALMLQQVDPVERIGLGVGRHIINEVTLDVWELSREPGQFEIVGWHEFTSKGFFRLIDQGFGGYEGITPMGVYALGRYAKAAYQQHYEDPQ